jgi:hypothetical protein
MIYRLIRWLIVALIAIALVVLLNQLSQPDHKVSLEPDQDLASTPGSRAANSASLISKNP